MRFPVEQVLATRSVSITELKRNPSAVLEQAGAEPVAVLNHNRPAFYMIEPQLFEAMMEELADSDLYSKAAARLADKSRAVEVSLDQL